ncbi:hypothetical protein J4Q44_G00379730 [Coregonus suidteri]|uniref:mRNA decay activator protein ZFP36 n=1 Tax=Coregonus suidteri TaxID=861788 RepID=A0AAN8QDG4_9TELE
MLRRASACTQSAASLPTASMTSTCPPANSSTRRSCAAPSTRQATAPTASAACSPTMPWSSAPPATLNIPCRTYRSFGVCPFGSRCNFLHIESDGSGSFSGGGLESPDSAAEDKVPIARPQPYTQGWKPRRALCRTFSSFGFCLYGTRCRFQHSLTSSIRGPDSTTQGGDCTPQLSGGRALSTASDMFSSSPCSSNSSSPPSGLPSPVWPDDSSPLTTLLNEPVAHNAFTFSCQLNDLLLPLALRLQKLENSQAMAAACTMQDVCENKPWSL